MRAELQLRNLQVGRLALLDHRILGSRRKRRPRRASALLLGCPCAAGRTRRRHSMPRRGSRPLGAS